MMMRMNLLTLFVRIFNRSWRYPCFSLSWRGWGSLVKISSRKKRWTERWFREWLFCTSCLRRQRSPPWTDINKDITLKKQAGPYTVSWKELHIFLWWPCLARLSKLTLSCPAAASKVDFIPCVERLEACSGVSKAGDNQLHSHWNLIKASPWW